jgi:hypothetical protein
LDSSRSAYHIRLCSHWIGGNRLKLIQPGLIPSGEERTAQYAEKAAGVQ